MKLLPLTPAGQTPIRALTIAGTDSGGGAGIQADSRTMAMCGVHACVAVAAVTVQNSVGVSGFHEIPPEIVADQVRVVVSDIGVGAAKTGMLASTTIIEAVAAVAAEVGIGRDRPIPLVVDPVCASMHGDPLLHEEALDAVRNTLIPAATVVTPNLDEVRLITGIEVVDDKSARQAAEALHALGAQWSIVKGGHLRTSELSTDLLFDGDRFPRIQQCPDRHRQRSRWRRHTGCCDHLCSRTRLFRSGRGGVRQGVGNQVPRGVVRPRRGTRSGVPALAAPGLALEVQGASSGARARFPGRREPRWALWRKTLAAMAGS